jgi:Txe/YoeB family toxin of Txe-Axe toxin-antitoxin module
MKMKRILILIFFAVMISQLVFAQEQPQLKIAVLDLKLDLSLANASAPEDQEVVKRASDRLRAEINKKVNYALIDPTQVDQVVESLKAQGSGCRSYECILEAGRILKADRVLVGKIVKISTLISIVSAQMVDVKSGKILKEEIFELKGNFPDIIPQGMPALSRRITEELDDRFPPSLQ